MKSLERMKEVSNQLDSMSYTGLSVAEQGMMSFLKVQLRRILESAQRLQANLDQKSWEEVLVNFMATVQRANLLYAYLMQPSVLSTVMSGKVWEVSETVLEAIFDLMAESISIMRRSLKEMNIDSLTLSLNSSPPSFNISVAMKGT
ncbi:MULTISPECIES: hypothetical protein [Metallosphaera]|uniref:Uncharacterized protein n=1 Tax=Metallosphaera cuprina (strain Ar-4) TaxID=1006006 RepID=F4FYT0_METCR|nr:hypothetical protein [Metallosphaera cuprina]AEB94319.1 conserved hypothetical protein [Metallosphaera cuprina Ar-4]